MIASDSVFHIGDKVVYPNHGVGVIEQISSQTIGMKVQQFYLLKIKASSLKVMIPCHNVGNVGLRKVVRNVEVKEILDYLMACAVGAAADWKERLKEKCDRIGTGSLLVVRA